MARISYPDPKSQDDSLRELLTRLGSLNITRMISHSEDLLKAYSKLGLHLLRNGRLDAVIREAVILRIGQLCGSDYEWHQHVSVARAVGMAPAILSAIETKNDKALPDSMRAALRVAEGIKSNGGADAQTISTASSHFDEVELVEIIMTSGYYIMTAGLLLSLDIEIEDTAPLGAEFSGEQS